MGSHQNCNAGVASGCTCNALQQASATPSALARARFCLLLLATLFLAAIGCSIALGGGSIVCCTVLLCILSSMFKGLIRFPCTTAICRSLDLWLLSRKLLLLLNLRLLGGLLLLALWHLQTVSACSACRGLL